MTINFACQQPWDDSTVASRLVRAIDRLERVRLDVALDEGLVTTGPAAYVQWLSLRPPRLTDLFGPLVATGKVPAYQGSAASGRSRLLRYRQTVRDIEDVEASDIYICVVNCATPHSALRAERALIGQYDGLLNKIGGWGARPPGARRRTQRSSAVDALLPGRRWVSPPSPRDVVRARASVVAYLAELDPSGRRWPVITPGSTVAARRR